MDATTPRPCNARFLPSERCVHPAHSYTYNGAPVHCAGWSAQEDADMNARPSNTSSPLGVPAQLFYPYR
ncbi:hypothetical protein [Streptomyces sp. NPDC058252]|uniref:hypothetical protein n=1 Tax=Streptomyces sp. NPDC058252 TaxID=3346405 RepID=UPI0036E67AA7